MLLERGIDVSYETIRRWMMKFGPQIASNLRRRQRCPDDVWHLDEVVVKIAGKSYYLWRAVDQHGVVLEEILQSKRDKRAAKRLLVKLIKRHGFIPKRMITPSRALLCNTLPGKGQTTILRRCKTRSGARFGSLVAQGSQQPG